MKEAIEQKIAVENFISEKCKDPKTGKNKGAHLDYKDTGEGDQYDGYDLPSSFDQKLLKHLTSYLDKLAEIASGPPIWDIKGKGSFPYRGLEVFDVEHAQIFYGRESEIVSIRRQLNAQAVARCAFVLIIGPSGSGKSSLARAGVIPEIVKWEREPPYGSWHYLTIKPSQLGSDLITGLIRVFSSAKTFDGLRQWQVELEGARNNNHDEFKVLFKTRVLDALKSKGDSGPGNRLILLLDQLEEIFSDESIAEHTRTEFFAVIERLARSGSVWVIATVRSDFYEHCQSVESLTAMRQGEGTFDLRLPT
ncbi:MAG: ATP-binding protein, partial [Pirellula sp.]